MVNWDQFTIFGTTVGGLLRIKTDQVDHFEPLKIYTSDLNSNEMQNQWLQ